MKKNTLKIFLAFVLSIVLLTGCGGHTHNFGDWEVLTPATHTATGIETRTCECGIVEEREISKTAEHEWGEWEVVTPATHTTPGKERRTCSCGETEERNTPKTTEHNWEIIETVNPGYSVGKGYYLYSCECGEQKREEIDYLNTFVKTFTISYFDNVTKTANVTITFDGFDDIVITGLEASEKVTDEFYVAYSVSNVSIVKTQTGFDLKNSQDLLRDIETNCATYHFHYHRYANGACSCGEESFRLVVEDIFSITGTGTIAVGTVEGKAIALGDKIQKYDATSNTFVEYTISGMESYNQPLDVAEPGTYVGISFEEAPTTTDFSRGDLLVTSEGSWTPVTSVSGIIHLPFRSNPLFNSYRPAFYNNGIEISGVVTLPSGVEYILPNDMVTVSVEFVNPILMLDKTEFVVREGGRTAGYFVTGYEEDELGTFVSPITIRRPATPGATPTTYTISAGHYLDANGNEYRDLALLEPTEIDYYNFYIGITGASVITNRGTLVSSTLEPYDNFGITWEVNVQVEVLIGKTCTLLVYDAEQSKTVEMESLIIGASSPNEGEYEFLLRGFDIADAQNAVAMYVL